MHRLVCLLERTAAGLDRRGRRLLLFAAATALTFFARATAEAGQAGDYAGAAMSGALTLLAAVFAALAWSVPRGDGRP
jgi:hypothetical protein